MGLGEGPALGCWKVWRISLLRPVTRFHWPGPTLPRPGLPLRDSGGPAGACRDSRAGRQGVRGGGPTLTLNPEGTYQACKLDPGVDRLRPGVPLTSTSLTAGLLGPGGGLPAGVRAAARAERALESRTQQVKVWQTGGSWAGQPRAGGVCQKEGWAPAGLGDTGRCRAGCRAAVGGGTEQGGCGCSLEPGRPPGVCDGSPGRRATALAPGHATSPDTCPR